MNVAPSELQSKAESTTKQRINFSIKIGLYAMGVEYSIKTIKKEGSDERGYCG